jgi:hypothetical protein
MKKIGEYTCRGVVAHQVTERIILFDGRFDTAYRVTKFTVSPQSITTTDNAAGTLFSDDDGSGSNLWKWDDNVQIAWAATEGITDAATAPFSMVDKDNLVVEDLFIRCSNSAGGESNYLIEMEKYKISEWRGALAMVRSKSQNVTSA